VSAIAFDLLHLVGADLRREPLEDRKETLANLLADASDCIQHSDVFTDSAKFSRWRSSTASKASSPSGSEAYSSAVLQLAEDENGGLEAANSDRDERLRMSRWLRSLLRNQPIP
jgi:ATP-dependent DNA ligase